MFKVVFSFLKRPTGIDPYPYGRGFSPLFDTFHDCTWGIAANLWFLLVALGTLKSALSRLLHSFNAQIYMYGVFQTDATFRLMLPIIPIVVITRRFQYKRRSWKTCFALLFPKIKILHYSHYIPLTSPLDRRTNNFSIEWFCPFSNRLVFYFFANTFPWPC